jgi:hypothetical protein
MYPNKRISRSAVEAAETDAKLGFPFPNIERVNPPTLGKEIFKDLDHVPGT